MRRKKGRAELILIELVPQTSSLHGYRNVGTSRAVREKGTRVSKLGKRGFMLAGTAHGTTQQHKPGEKVLGYSEENILFPKVNITGKKTQMNNRIKS